MSIGAVIESARATRYQTKSNPPPGLMAVMSCLQKAFRRRMTLHKQEIRSVAARAEREYAIPGRADDLYRFLMNVQVLIENPASGRCFFDTDRASLVLSACANHASVPWIADAAEVRIAKIHGEFAPSASAPGSNAGVDHEPAGEGAGQKTEVVDAEESSPEDARAESQPMVDAPVLPRGVLYLTPVECDVWVALNGGTEDDEVAIPRAPEACLAKFRTPLVQCTREEFLRAVRRFESSPLVETVKENEGCIRYRWNPTGYELIEIKRRVPLSLSADIAQAVMAHLTASSGTVSLKPPDVEALLQESIPRENPLDTLFRPLTLAHLRWLYLGGELNDGLCWRRPLFVAVDPAQEDRLTPTVPPFLPVRFYAPSLTPRIVAHVYHVVDPESLKEMHVLSPTTERERNIMPADAPIFSPDGEIEDGLVSRETLSRVSLETLQRHAKLLAAVRELPIQERAAGIAEEIARRNEEGRERQRRQAMREELDTKMQAVRAQAREAQALLEKLETEYLALDK